VLLSIQQWYKQIRAVSRGKKLPPVRRAQAHKKTR